MSQMAKAFADIKEDYLSTRQEALNLQLGSFELFLAFGKQLAVQIWAVTHLRIIVAFLASVSAQLPTFIATVAMFALITFYLPLPFGLLSRAFLGARLILTLLLFADVSGFGLFRHILLFGKSSTSLFILIAVSAGTGALFLLVTAVNLFMRRTSQSSNASMAIIGFYTIVLGSFVIAVSTEDKFVEGWLSFGILLASLLNFFMLWSREARVTEVEN